MRGDYTAIDMFRYVKFLEENPKLKNNITAIKKYNEKFPKLTDKQKLENLKNSFMFKQEL